MGGAVTSRSDARGRIVAAAADVFAARGFEGARIDEIAARAGANKAMLYYHVGDKERLYAAVLVGSIDRALELLRAATAAPASPPDKLQAILVTLAEFGTSNPEFIPIVLREVAAGGHNMPDELFARLGSVFRIVGDVLREGVAAGVFRETDPLLTHVALVGALMYLRASHPIRARVALLAGLPMADHAPADLARVVGDLFVRGLLAPFPPKATGARRPRPVARITRKRRGGNR
jgi:AcrR family transcriptional regulator